MLDFIAYPLGRFLYFIYNTLGVHNYGLSLLIFTVIIKLALLPLTIKQYRSTVRMQELQPKIQEIQKRYKNDKEKLNQELMKVYQENNYNPASGCLPLLIQMPILISLYWVIIQPLKFMLNKAPDQITKLTEYVTGKLGAATMGYSKEIGILNYFNTHRDELANFIDILKPEELINMKFLGLDLGQIATYNPSLLFGEQSGTYLPLLLLPIIGVITTYISSKMAMPKVDPNSKEPNTAASMGKSMLFVGPIMTLVFSFQLPAGVILYWIAGYVFQIFQQLYLNKYVIKKKEVVTK
jgi:YidC/Oxa1 family membrane protein insertase